jgi:hypothetical protein
MEEGRKERRKGKRKKKRERGKKERKKNSLHLEPWFTWIFEVKENLIAKSKHICYIKKSRTFPRDKLMLNKRVHYNVSFVFYFIKM